MSHQVASSWLRSAPSNARDTQLDGFRGLAILLVIVFHVPRLDAEGSLAGRLATLVPSLGFSGVDAFFVLSGFLITRILLRERHSQRYFRTFWGRRMLRIFPLYYLVLFLQLVLLPCFVSGELFWNASGTREPLWFWLYLTNFYDGLAGIQHHSMLNLTWSLAIEEQFYLLWPLVVRLLSIRRLSQLCLGLVFISFACRCIGLWAGSHPLLVYELTPMRMDGLAMGGWIAARSRLQGGTEPLRRIASWMLPASAVVLLAVAIPIQIDPFFMSDRPRQILFNPAFQTVGYSAIVLFYGSVLIWIQGRSPGRGLRGFFELPFLTRLGKYSYAMYLLHLWAIEAVRHWILPVGLPFALAWLLTLALSLALLLIACAWIWRLVEEPALRLRRYFPYDREPTPARL